MCGHWRYDHSITLITICLCVAGKFVYVVMFVKFLHRRTVLVGQAHLMLQHVFVRVST